MTTQKLARIFRPFLNIKFLVSFGIAWLLTNGWCYICVALSVRYHVKWLTAVSSAYITFLYLPFTVEKIVTVPLAVWFQMHLFPHDAKLHRELLEMEHETRKIFREIFRKAIIRKNLRRIGE